VDLDQRMNLVMSLVMGMEMDMTMESVLDMVMELGLVKEEVIALVGDGEAL
jgi:hypothetical protein